MVINAAEQARQGNGVQRRVRGRATTFFVKTDEEARTTCISSTEGVHDNDRSIGWRVSAVILADLHVIGHRGPFSLSSSSR